MKSLAVKKPNTILSLLLKGENYLKGKGIAQSRLNAESLLAYSLKVSRESLYCHFEETIPQEKIKNYWELIIKRANHIPLQYLAKRGEFWSIPLTVDERAFIPRAETELVVEEVLRLSPSGELKIADIGTGCGNIALAIARELPSAKLFATDISLQALALARENAHSLGLEHRITFLQGDLLSALKGSHLQGEIDFIVSNPPYIMPQELEQLEPEVRLYEPKVALVASEPGLGIYQRLIKEAENYLKPGGYLIVEMGINQLPQLVAIFQDFAFWRIESIREDLNHIPRIICGCFKGA